MCNAAMDGHRLVDRTQSSLCGAFSPARLGQIVSRLTTHPEVGVAPPLPFERQRHMSRYRGAPVQYSGQRRPRATQSSRSLGDRQAARFDALQPDGISRMGGFAIAFMRQSPSMVVDQIDVHGSYSRRTCRPVCALLIASIVTCDARSPIWAWRTRRLRMFRRRAIDTPSSFVVSCQRGAKEASEKGSGGRAD